MYLLFSHLHETNRNVKYEDVYKNPTANFYQITLYIKSGENRHVV